MKYENNVMEKRDFARIDKLNTLTCAETFYEDLARLTRKVRSEEALYRWNELGEVRYRELTRERVMSGDNTFLIGLYKRTIKNCRFYENDDLCKGKMNEHLLNEIGCLRGIVYALEVVGEDFFYDDYEFERFIDLANAMTKDESDKWQERIKEWQKSR